MHLMENNIKKKKKEREKSCLPCAPTPPWALAAPSALVGLTMGSTGMPQRCWLGNAGLAFQDPVGFQASFPSWAMDSTLKIMRKLLSAHPCVHYRARS